MGKDMGQKQMSKMSQVYSGLYLTVNIEPATRDILPIPCRCLITQIQSLETNGASTRDFQSCVYSITVRSP